MLNSFTVKVTTAIVIGLAALLALGLIAAHSIDVFYRAGREVRRTLEVQGQLDNIQQNVAHAEVAQIRFRVSGDVAASEEFRTLTYQVRGTIAVLDGLLAEPDQKDRVRQLERVVVARFRVLDEAIRQRRPGEPVLLSHARRIAASKEIEKISDAIATRDRQLIEEREGQLQAQAESTAEILLWTGALAVLVLLWAIVIINRYERDRRRSERELRGARERLTIALEASNSAIWDWDLIRDEIYLSAGWPRMLGEQPRETTVSPTALLGLVHPDDLDHVQTTVQDTLKGRTSDYREEHRVKRSDGHWMWILSHGRIVGRSPDGRPLRMAGTNQDITERKRIELALREHDERLRLALETATMAGWQWDVAADEFSWQDSPEHLVGPPSEGGYLGLQDMVHPEDLVRFIRTLNGAVRIGEIYRDEFRITRTDGRIAWVLARGRNEYDTGGKVVRVVGVVQDITEIKEAEQALRASERRMRLITDAVPAVISYADASERVRFANRAMLKILGIRPEAAVVLSLRDILGETGYAHAKPFIRRALAGEEVQFERIQMTPRGPVDLSVTYVPRRDERGEIDGFYALATDISELKRLDRMKSEFVSTVSHELRTPLTSIRGSLGVLAGGIAGALPDKAREFVEIAKNNCERLIRLINDILDMEKIESGKMAFELRVLDLMEMIEQIVKANEGFAAQHKVRLQVVAARPGSRVYADSDRLTQVLTNLISNACKFSPSGSTVDIAISADQQRVRVGIVDHGPGISEEFQKRIFQKFSQEDSSDIRQKGGTGLGLSISRAIVEGMGGEIGFESVPGKGATFYVLLPEWHGTVAADAAPSTGRPRVLVCEDDADVGRLLQIMVDKAGCEADLALNAAQAKALMRERRYAAITLDLGLPDQDGLSFLRELRASAEAASIPVIVVSAVAQEGRLKIGGERLGVVDWLSKPIDEDRLLADLRSTLNAGTRRLRILHVEDDADVRNVVAALVRDIGYFEAAASIAEAKSKLKHGSFDLVLLDLGLPDGSGLELLPLVESMTPRPRVVIFSAKDAEAGRDAPEMTFLVKSHTSEQQLIDAIKNTVARTT